MGQGSLQTFRSWMAMAALLVCVAGGNAQEAASLESLRLGANYLRWTPAADGAPSAATAPPERLPPPAMTLAEWEEMAMRNNPTLCQAVARVQAAEGEQAQAGLYPNPRAGYQASEIGDEGQAGQQGAFVAQEFVTAGKLQLARDVAAHAVRQAQWALAAQRGRVQSDVRRAFYDVLVAQRSVELTDQLLLIGRQGMKAAEQLLKAKEVSRVDILQARIEAESAQILAEKARNRHLAAWRNLLAVTSVADMPPAPLAGDLQDGLALLNWEEAVNRLLAESPVLAEARVGVCRAEVALNREIAGRVPNVDVQASAQYDNATQDRIAGIEVGMPMPIFNRNQGNIRKAQAHVALARAEVCRVSLELKQRLATAFEQYQNARSQVERYASEILPSAQASLDLVTAGYRQGEFNYITLLTSQRTFFQANLAYIEAIRDLRTSAVAIDGNLLGDSLQQR